MQRVDGGPRAQATNAEQLTATARGPNVVTEPNVDRIAKSIHANLCRRFPAAADEWVRACVDEAVRELGGARVRSSLPILIERRAIDRLRAQHAGHGLRGEAAPKHARV